MNILKFKNQIKEKRYDGCWGIYRYFIDCDEICNIVELCKKKTLKNGIKDYKNLCWNCYWFDDEYSKKCAISFRNNLSTFRDDKRKGNCEKEEI